MSAGTIKLTNGSTAVVGTGTAFTSDLKSGDVITATVGGIFFTLFVDAVTSNTALTLTDPFTGPTTSGLAWVAVPQLALNRITAALAAQTAESVRRVLQENANWQAFYSGTGDITVTLPDGSPAGRPVTGPSWPKMSELVTSAIQWRGNVPSSANLNTYGPLMAGQWGSVFSGVLTSNGFPEDGALGVFEVFSGGPYGCYQRYTVRSGNIYVRALTAPWNGTDGPWGEWQLSGVNTRPGYFSGDLNNLITPGNWSIAADATNAPMSGEASPPSGICEVIPRTNTGAILQRYTVINNTSAIRNRTWQRTLFGTNWSPWELLGVKAINDLGVGLSAIQAMSSFDWQQFDFLSGAIYYVSSSNITNMPAGVTYNTGTGLYIIVRGNAQSGSRNSIQIIPDSIPNSNYREYEILSIGAKGSRSFAVRQIFTTADTIPIANGGTGSSSPFGTTAGKFVQGNDSRLATVDGKSGGVITGTVNIEGQNLNLRSTSVGGGWPSFITFMAGQGNNLAYARVYQENSGGITIQCDMNGTSKYSQFNTAGDFSVQRNITCVALTQTSDRDKKYDIKPIENALDKVLSLDGVTFNWKESNVPSAGVIAQELVKVLPEAVGSVFDDRDEYDEVEEEQEFEEEQPFEEEDEEGNPITVYRTVNVKRIVKVNRLIKKRDDTKRSYTVEYAGVVALCLQAIKELNAKVENLEKKLNPQETEEQPDAQQ